MPSTMQPTPTPWDSPKVETWKKTHRGLEIEPPKWEQPYSQRKGMGTSMGSIKKKKVRHGYSMGSTAWSPGAWKTCALVVWEVKGWPQRRNHQSIQTDKDDPTQKQRPGRSRPENQSMAHNRGRQNVARQPSPKPCSTNTIGSNNQPLLPLRAATHKRRFFKQRVLVERGWSACLEEGAEGAHGGK